MSKLEILVQLAIQTREDLAAYDPELYKIINKAMAYDNHADWRLRVR